MRIFFVRRLARAFVCAGWLISITGLAQAAPVAAATRAELEGRLQKAARGLSATEVADLGPGAGALLVQIADDRAVATTTRARAMEALTYVRTPATRDFLENFLIRKRPSSDSVDHLLLRKAAIALGWQAGPRSVDAVAALLDHPDPEVRLDAVVALGLTRARSAEKPLRERLAAETDATVRAQIESQLRVLAEPTESGKRARNAP